MILRTGVALLLAGSLQAVELRVATYNIGAHFSEGGYPDYALGDPGTIDHDAVRAVLQRIDADVVALQEVHSADLAGSPDDVDALAAALGCPYVHGASTSGSFDTSLRVVFLSKHPFLDTRSIGSPPGAKEVTRLFPAVTVDVPGTDADPVLVSAHLKAGTTSADRFRRAVEMRRLAGWLASSGLGASDNFIVLGDFNPSGTDASFGSLPSGLPGTYDLGEDIAFPVSYSTRVGSYFAGPVPTLLDPRQLNGSDGTFQYGQTLDLLLVSPGMAARPHATEVYNSALDVSNVEGLAKSGVPLAAATSLDASDHYAVFADFELDSEAAYVLAQPGEAIIEDFDGFGGLRDPAPWSSGGAAWRGADDGGSAATGARAYGVGDDPAVGFVVRQASPAVLEASYTNGTEVPLTMLDLAYDAEQWRSAEGGAEDAIMVEWGVDGATFPIPELGFVARTDLPDGPVSGGNPKRRAVRIAGLSIDPGESFTLRFRFVPGSGSAPAPADVWINEFHYDNEGTDTGEFIEVVVAPGHAGPLEDLGVIRYNGSNPGAATIDGAVLSLAEDFIEAGNYDGYRVFVADLPSNGIQNGSNDGFAVVDTAASTVLHLLSYEGSFTAAEGPAAGMESADIGVDESNSDPTGGSLGLVGTGAEAGDYAWSKFGAHSKGVPNAGQSFVAPGLPPQGLAIDRVTVAFVPDRDLDGLADDLDPDDDNDGQSDDFELAFGSDPFDRASTFEPRVLRDGGQAILSFPGADGVAYTVQWCDDLVSWDHEVTVLGEGKPVSLTLPTGGGRWFARVAVSD